MRSASTKTRTRPGRQRAYHHGDLRRALIDVALELVTREQDWAFSIRELARRAGVSHRAPYNHFAEKLDLLAAVAAVGFERLRVALLRAIDGIDDREAALIALCRTYLRLGLENPALYRLMFGPALSATGAVDRPTVARVAGAQARAVLEDVILEGARAGVFVLPAGAPNAVALAALSVWSATHGLTMLLIDRIPPPNLSVEDMTETLLRSVIGGLRQARMAHSAQAR